jgi:two-component system response regulator FixJ
LRRLPSILADDTHERRRMAEGLAFVVHVIDDDEAVRESLEALLVVSGFDVTTHASAASYLDGEQAGGCVLVDVHMPGMDGLELLRVLARDEPWTPVLLLTASHELRLREQALELGARAFLTKPVREVTLIGALRALRDNEISRP